MKIVTEKVKRILFVKFEEKQAHISLKMMMQCDLFFSMFCPHGANYP